MKYMELLCVVTIYIFKPQFAFQLLEKYKKGNILKSCALFQRCSVYYSISGYAKT